MSTDESTPAGTTGTVPPSAPDWWRETDEARVAETRAQYLRRAMPWADADARPIALALAYRHLGYSHSGVAARLETTEATVADYMDAVADHHGLPALETALPAELETWPDGRFPQGGARE